MVVEGLNPNYEDLELGEARPGQVEQRSKVQLRLALGGFTLFLMILGPVLQYYYADIFLYILAAGIAFTIGTNLTIGVLSVRIEDKAEIMERRIEDLLEQLSTSTDQLTEFNGQLAQFPLESMLVSLQEAREELTPTLASIQDISWSQVAQAIDLGLKWFERVDSEKIGSLLSPFIREAPPVDLLDDPFVEEAEIDFFPPPPPRMRS